MKSDNISYRYDEEKMAFLMDREKLDNPRKALDFLLDKYWWEKKFNGTPIIPAQNQLGKEPISLPKPPPIKLSLEEEYWIEFTQAKSQKELTNSLLAMQADSELLPQIKARLKSRSESLFDKFFND